MNISLRQIFLMMLLAETSLVCAQNNNSLFTAPLGVQAFTFRKSFPVDIAKTLDTIKMMGFTEIESTAHGLAPEAFKKLCDERGISVPSSEASFDQFVTAPDSVAHVAKLLGAKYVMCAWVPHKGAFTLED